MDATSKVARIPQVDKVLRHPLMLAEQERIKREILTELTRRELEELRENSARLKDLPDLETIVQSIIDRARQLTKPGLTRIINATGVILNTNLGRAPLPADVLGHLSEIACGYCNLEFELESGKRGERGGHIETLLRLLTGCQAAIVVNNNAAAVLLAVNTLARNREVIVSRGELIEIGGSFRLPEVIVAAGGTLIEVGTTNRTRIGDFRQAINENTALMLRCHRSNFEIRGFTEEVTLDELVALSRTTGIPLLEDLGSGALIDLCESGLGSEPTVASQVEAGSELVTFSGDKLLGGPQAGIIAGRKDTVQRLRKNPLYRALRPDKLTLSALEAVLRHYLSPNPASLIPALTMALMPASQLEERAKAFAARANLALKKINCEVVATESTPGGGSLPGRTQLSFGITLRCRIKPNQLAAYLRRASPPVVAVVKEDQTVLDFRTVRGDEENLLLDALLSIDQIA